MTGTELAAESPPASSVDSADSGGRSLVQSAVRLLRGFPRPVQQTQLAGFLGTCRAHPLASAALDYAARKEEQAERAEQRQEREFWGQVRNLLADLHPTPLGNGEADDRAAGRRATALAQHLVAENLLRQAQMEAAKRAAAPRFGSGQRPTPVAPNGGQRD